MATLTTAKAKLVNLMQADVDAMPESPGLLYIKSDDGVLLTLSASDNLKARAQYMLNGHFGTKVTKGTYNSRAKQDIIKCVDLVGGFVRMDYVATTTKNEARKLKKATAPFALCNIDTE